MITTEDEDEITIKEDGNTVAYRTALAEQEQLNAEITDLQHKINQRQGTFGVVPCRPAPAMPEPPKRHFGLFLCLCIVAFFGFTGGLISTISHNANYTTNKYVESWVWELSDNDKQWGNSAAFDHYAQEFSYFNSDRLCVAQLEDTYYYTVKTWSTSKFNPDYQVTKDIMPGVNITYQDLLPAVTAQAMGEVTIYRRVGNDNVQMRQYYYAPRQNYREVKVTERGANIWVALQESLYVVLIDLFLLGAVIFLAILFFRHEKLQNAYYAYNSYQRALSTNSQNVMAVLNPMIDDADALLTMRANFPELQTLVHDRQPIDERQALLIANAILLKIATYTQKLQQKQLALKNVPQIKHKKVILVTHTQKINEEEQILKVKQKRVVEVEKQIVTVEVPVVQRAAAVSTPVQSLPVEPTPAPQPQPVYQSQPAYQAPYQPQPAGRPNKPQPNRRTTYYKLKLIGRILGILAIVCFAVFLVTMIMPYPKNSLAEKNLKLYLFLSNFKLRGVLFLAPGFILGMLWLFFTRVLANRYCAHCDNKLSPQEMFEGKCANCGHPTIQKVKKPMSPTAMPPQW